MRRFYCKVIREDEYIIEFYENIINEEWMKDFREYFYNFETLKDHAEHLAQLRARTEDQFFEGYGKVTIINQGGWEQKGIIDSGIKIIVVSEDEYRESETEEIK